MYKNVHIFAVLALVVSANLFSNSMTCAATRMTLNGQVFGLANQIKRNLKENPLVQGQQLQMGVFEGGSQADASNFGLRIENLLRIELTEVLSESARLRLIGSYHFIDSSEPTLKGIKILLITARVTDDRDRELASWSVEVNDTDNVMQVLGLTGAAPLDANASFEQRNQTVQSAQAKPAFKLLEGDRIAAESQPAYSVGLLSKSTATGKTEPVTPQNVAGLAFVPIQIGQYYEITLANSDSSDVVATVTVDGLDVANTFSIDVDSSAKRIQWPGYLVPAGQKVVIRGWLHTLKEHSKENLFSFKIDQLGKGVASLMNTRGSVGVVTVQFREACSPQGRLSGRSFGETSRGEGLEEKLTAKPVQIGENVLSTVSLRYNRPQVPK